MNSERSAFTEIEDIAEALPAVVWPSHDWLDFLLGNLRMNRRALGLRARYTALLHSFPRPHPHSRPRAGVR